MQSQAYRKQVPCCSTSCRKLDAKDCFALYGGNRDQPLVRDMSRLSVDIDLTYDAAH